MALGKCIGFFGFSFAFTDLIVAALDKILPFNVSLCNTNRILIAVIAKTENHKLDSFSLEFILPKI